MATTGATNGVATRSYIRWDAPGVEEIQPNEAEDTREVVKQINCIQRAQYNLHRVCHPLARVVRACTDLAIV